MRDSGFVIEVDLPVLESGDEVYTKKKAILVFNGSVPYALTEINGKLFLFEIDREVMRYGVRVVGGINADSAMDTLVND
jgi:hypothetical protein